MSILTKTEKATLNFYDKVAINYHRDRPPGAKTFWRKDLNTFHKLLPGGKILEIGVGGGREAAELIKFGYVYTGVEPSKGLLDEVKKEKLKGKFLNFSVYNLDFPDKNFDGFWTCATLIHMPKKRIKEVLENIKRVIKPGGIGFISLKKGIGESFDKPGERFFAYYTKREFIEILNDVNI